MINTQEDYNKALIKHIKKLREMAEKAQPKDIIEKINRYYSGRFNKQKDKVQNQRNVIKNIVETKTTMVLDSKIATSVVPATRSMATIDNLATASKLADIMNDCVKDVFKDNSFDSFKSNIIRNTCKKLGVAELTVEPNQKIQTQVDIKLSVVPLENFFPDPSCKEVQDGNFHFIKYMKSAIGLKAKYPQYAEKIDKLVEQLNKDYKDRPTGVITSTVENNTYQSFAYGDPGKVLQNAIDVPVWKCYLKDDSTFNAEESTMKNPDTKQDLETLKAKYPNGRMILFCGEDIILEDQAIPYKFGYPLEICYDIEGGKIWECTGEIEDLFENQDGINRAYTKAREMIGKSASWILFDPRSGLSKEDFVNKTTLQVENLGSPGNVPQVLANNTTEKFNLMIDYLAMLKEDAYDIARINSAMVSGQTEATPTSGEQVKALQESPMAGIRYLQRNFKDFMVSLTDKIIIMIQTHYTTPRIIRLTTGDNMMARLPTAGSGGAIEIYEKNGDVVNLIKQINGDLTLCDFDVDVIAGSERPRSRAENSQMIMELYQLGILGNDLEAKNQLLQEMDVPDRRVIMERLKKTEEETSKMPPIDITNPEIMKSFAGMIKDLAGFTEARMDLLEKAGLPTARDTIVDAPVQEITSKGDATMVTSMRAELGEVPQNVTLKQMDKDKAKEQSNGSSQVVGGDSTNGLPVSGQ